MVAIDLSRWGCTEAQVEILRDPSAYLDLTQQSVPIANLRTEPTAATDDAAAAAAAAEALPLFGAVRRAFVTGSPKAQSTGKRRRGGEPARPAGGGCGAVLYAGGSVWALDWSPAVASQGSGGSSGGSGSAAIAGSRQDESGASEPYSSQILAVSAHPRGREGNVIGRAVHGPGCIQLWEVRCRSGSGSSSSAGPRQGRGELLGTPRMALALCHDGGVAWDAKWCPLRPPAHGSDDPGLPRVGWLAVALGSGDIVVAAVPHPAAVTQSMRDTQRRHPQQRHQQEGKQEAPLAVRLSSSVTLPAARIGGSLPATLEWLPRPPHDTLLAGHWDGTVAMWRLAPRAGSALSSVPFAAELLLHIRTNEGPIRSVAWAPAALSDDGAALAGHSVFMTTSHDGQYTIWDARDIYHPVWQIQLGVAYILSADWPAPNLPPLVSTDNGFLHALLPYPRTSTHQRDTLSTVLRSRVPGAIWSVHTGVTPGGGMRAAYGCEDGGVYTLEHVELRDRRAPRPPHIAVCGWKEEGDGLAFLGSSVLSKASDAAQSAKMPKAPAPGSFPSPPLVAVHRVRWSHSANSGGGGGGGSGSCAKAEDGAATAGWLAHGGAAGLVCLQHLP